MSADKSKMLARLHRVRTLQLGLARADEVRHAEALASEHQLTQRISALVDAVAPTTLVVRPVTLLGFPLGTLLVVWAGLGLLAAVAAVVARSRLR